MDVKSSFLHVDLIEEIYMEQPLGFVQDINSVQSEKIFVWLEIGTLGMV